MRLSATVAEDQGIGRVALVILIVGLGMLLEHATALGDKHGGWDAFAIWNFHSRYLADPANWRNLFLNTDTEHPDYPPGQPALSAFCLRLFSGKHQELIAYMWAMFFTISVPLLLFSGLWNKNRIVALIVFYIVCANNDFVGFGVSQYADMLVAALALGAYLAVEAAEERQEWCGVAVFLLTAAALTKNEGALIAVLFFVFYGGRFFRGRRWLYALSGAVLPLACLIAYRSVCPVHSDMLGGIGSGVWQKIADVSRYRKIYESVNAVADSKFHYLQVFVLLAFIVSLFRKSVPGRGAWLVLAWLAGYFAIYVVTPHDLEWHLQTSLDRLLLQVMPVALYLASSRLSDVGINVTGKLPG